MKKTLTYITLALLLTLSSCVKDDRNNNMVDDSLTLTASDDVQQSSVHAGTFTFGVAKSGKGTSSARAVVSPDGAKALLDAYNKAEEEKDPHFESLEAIPSDKFTVHGGNITWEESEFVKEVSVSWDPEALASYIGDKENCVIALCVTSSDLKVNPDKDLMLIHLTCSSLSLTQTVLSRVVESSKVEPGEDGTVPELKENFIFDLEMNHEIKGVGLSVPVMIDNSLIAEFNATQEEQYVAAPEGLFTLSSEEAIIGEGSRSTTFRGVLDKSKLLVGGKLEEFPPYVIPVRVDVSALNATMNGEEFDLKGLSYGNLVAYITVTWKASHTGELSITREWGLYSTASAAWNESFGGTPNSDRNVAMDNEYVFVAETNTTKNLWAVSISDPTNVRKLPVGTVLDEGIFYLCCPRVIPNEDPAVNGGKDVLVVSNMNEGDPRLYFYVNGIENDPKVVKANTWAGRRLGDTFTFAGTLQNGILFFKDFNSAQGTVTFPLLYKPTTEAVNLVRRLEAPAVTGAGSYFPFPDNMYRGICSVRGNEEYMSQLVTVPEGQKFDGGTGGITPALTPLSGYYRDAAFRFFEYGGKRYVAYSRQVSGSDGRLIILEGAPEDDWTKILEDRNIVYQAAIQEDAEMQDEYNASPKSSGHSGMDIDVRQINGDVYIVVIKQNVGLSLFRMTK